MNDADIERRHARAAAIVAAAASTALGLFRTRDALAIESKGLQDWVSEADRQVEREIRAALAADFPTTASSARRAVARRARAASSG